MAETAGSLDHDGCSGTASILRPGRNCWRSELADRAAFLVDAEAYFQAFRSAAMKAERSIFIVGWELDSRIDLIRNGSGDDLPAALGDFLFALVKQKPELQIYILLWDYSLLFGMSREWFPEFRIGSMVHERLHLRKDNFCPIGSSLHRKIVVMDEHLAFVGGIDLARERWDRRLHSLDDPGRIDPDGRAYRPVHDIQLMVSGDIGAALGELVRASWNRIGDNPLQAPAMGGPRGRSWPDGVRSELRRVAVGIARTEPDYEEQEEVREVEQLYLDSIGAACRSIYIENQYLTAPRIVDALAAGLARPDGPEVIIVLPLQTDGWLSQYTMDLLRANAIRRLRSADRFSRLLVCYPYRKGLTPRDSIKVHSKLMIVDERLVRIGSANLNNRSMGLDTECDLAIEVHGADDEEKVRELREQLLCEHLGVSRTIFRRALQQKGSLKKAIAYCNSRNRALRELPLDISKSEEVWLENQNLFDPERPIDPLRMYREILPVPEDGDEAKLKVHLTVLILILLGGAISWHFLPLDRYLEGRHFHAAMHWFRDHPYAEAILFTAYVVGGLLVVPITLLVSLTILAFGTMHGALYALIGSVLNASVTYWVGSIMGKKMLRRMTGSYIDKVNRFLVKRGIVSTIVIRLVPLAPFSIINMLAGASHLRFRAYLFGTIVGMTPGILAMAGLFDRGIEMASDPNAISVSVFVGLAAAVGLAFWLLQKWLMRSTAIWGKSYD